MSVTRHKTMPKHNIFAYTTLLSIYDCSHTNYPNIKNICMTDKNIKRALIVAVVVGSLLNTINSYDVFWYGNFTTRNVIRIVLTYITPFCVSLYSSVKATKSA